MPVHDASPWLHHAPHEPPRILVAIADPSRMALVRSLRDTGYEVISVGLDPLPADATYDLAIAEAELLPAGDVPVVLFDPLDHSEVEMTVLELLAWDGPVTVRRGPEQLSTGS